MHARSVSTPRFLATMAASAMLLMTATTLGAPEAQTPVVGARVVQGMSGQGMRGITLPSRQVMLNAPVDGRLDRVLVEVGDRIVRDQVLAVMDDALQRRQVELMAVLAASELDRQRAELELAEAEEMVQQVQQVYDRGGASSWELRREQLRRELARNNVQRAAEMHERAQIELKLEQERLERYQLRADWDGRVRHIAAHSGATLTRQDPVMQIVDTYRLHAELYIPMALYGQLHEGKLYQLQALEPLDTPMQARLKMIDSILDPASRTFRCIFEVENPDDLFPGGMTVELIWPQPGEGE